MPIQKLLPDGRTLSIPDNFTAEEYEKLNIKINEMYGRGSGEAPEEPNISLGGRAVEFAKGLPRGFLQGWAMTGEGIVSLFDKDNDSYLSSAFRDFRQDLEDNPFIGSDPEYRNLYTTQIGAGLGNFGTFFTPYLTLVKGAGALGLAGKGLEKANKVAQIAPWVLAPAMGVSQQAERIVDKQQEEDISTQTEIMSELLGGAIGFTELLPVFSILRKTRSGDAANKITNKWLTKIIQKASPKGMEKGVALGVGATRSAVGQGATEAVQEGVAGLLQDLVSAKLYDPSLPIGQSFYDDVKVGGGVGFIADILRSALTPGRSRSIIQDHEERKKVGTGRELAAKAGQGRQENKVEGRYEVQPLVDSEGKKTGEHGIVFLKGDQKRSDTFEVDSNNQVIKGTQDQMTNESTNRNNANKQAIQLSELEDNADDQGVKGDRFGLTALILGSSSQNEFTLSDITTALGLNNKEDIRKMLSKLDDDIRIKLKDGQSLTVEEIQKSGALKGKDKESGKSYLETLFETKAETTGVKPKKIVNKTNYIGMINQLFKDKNINEKVSKKDKGSKNLRDFFNHIVGKNDLSKMTPAELKLVYSKLSLLNKSKTLRSLPRITKSKYTREHLNKLEEARNEKAKTGKQTFTRKEIQEVTEIKDKATLDELIETLIYSKRLSKSGNKLEFFKDNTLIINKSNYNQPIAVKSENDFQKYQQENTESFYESPQEFASRLYTMVDNNGKKRFTEEQIKEIVREEEKRKQENTPLNSLLLPDTREKGNISPRRQLEEAELSAERGNSIKNQKKIEELEKGLNKELKKKGLQGIKIRLSNFIMSPTIKGKKINVDEHGAYLRNLRTIILNINSVDPHNNIDDPAKILRKLIPTLNHEIIHALRGLDLFTQQEWDSLVTQATNRINPEKSAKGKTFLETAREDYKGDSQEVIEEEAVAEMYRHWTQNKKSITGQPRSFLERISDFFKSLISAIKGTTYKTYEEVFESIRESKSNEVTFKDEFGRPTQEAIGSRAQFEEFTETDESGEEKTVRLPAVRTKKEADTDILSIIRSAEDDIRYRRLEPITEVTEDGLPNNETIRALTEKLNSLQNFGYDEIMDAIEYAKESLGLTARKFSLDEDDTKSYQELKLDVEEALTKGDNFNWYKDIGESVSAHVGSNNMLEFSVLWGITSQQEQPVNNLKMALKTMLLARGINPVTGEDLGFNINTNKEKFLELLRKEKSRVANKEVAPEYYTGFSITGNQFDSLIDFYDTGLWETGEKNVKTKFYSLTTNNRAVNDYVPIGVMDRHMARIFGLPTVIAKKKGVGGQPPTDIEHSYMQYMLNRLSKEKFEDTRIYYGIGSGGTYQFSPDQIQALLWFQSRRNQNLPIADASAPAILERSHELFSLINTAKQDGNWKADEPLIDEFKDRDALYKNNTRRNAYNQDNLEIAKENVLRNGTKILTEAKFGNGRGYLDLVNQETGESIELNLDQLNNLTKDVFNSLTINKDNKPQILYLYNRGVPHDINIGFGSYDGSSSPNIEIKFYQNEISDEVIAYAKLFADALMQDSVIIQKITKDGDQANASIMFSHRSLSKQNNLIELERILNEDGGYPNPFNPRAKKLKLGFTQSGNDIWIGNVVKYTNGYDALTDLQKQQYTADFTKYVVDKLRNSGINGDINYVITEDQYYDQRVRQADGSIRNTYEDSIGRLGYTTSTRESSHLQTTAISEIYQPIWNTRQRFLRRNNLKVGRGGVSRGANNPPYALKGTALQEPVTAKNAEEAIFSLDEINKGYKASDKIYNINDKTLDISAVTADEVLKAKDNEKKLQEIIRRTEPDDIILYRRNRDNQVKVESLGSLPDVDRDSENNRIPAGRYILNLLKNPVQGYGDSTTKQFFRKFRQSFIDKYNAISESVHEWGIETNNEITADITSEGALRLGDRVNAWMSEIITKGGYAKLEGTVLKGGTVVETDYDKITIRGVDGSVLDASFLQLMDLLQDKTTKQSYEDEFQRYAMWKRMKTLVETNDQYTMLDNPVADQYLAAGKRKDQYESLKRMVENDSERMYILEQTNPNIVNAYKIWQNINDGTIQYAIDTGVLNEEMGEFWRDHASYFPFYRELDGEESGGAVNSFFGENGFGMITRKGKVAQLSDAVLTREWKELHPYGKLQPALNSMMQNTLAITKLGAKNIARQRIVREQNELGTGREVTAKQISEYDQGQLFNFKVNGEDKFYAVDDMQIVQALESYGGDLTLSGVLSIFGIPAGILREMVTRDPGFIAVNLMRDTLSAFATSGANFIPVIDTVKGFLQPLDQLEKFGVVGGYDLSADPKDLRKFINKKYRLSGEYDDGSWSSLRTIEKGWDVLGGITTRSDAATRNAVFNVVLDKTGNEFEAAFQALEIINFNRRGASMPWKVITTSIPFLNARIQGLDVFWRAAATSATRKKGTYKKQYGALRSNYDPNDAIIKRGFTNFFVRTAMISALTAMYWMLVSDDDEYKKVRQEVRDDNYIIPITDDFAFKIPIAFEVGVITKVLPERILETLFGDGTGRDAYKSAKRHITQTFGLSPMNIQLIAPMLEAMTNYDSFKGTPIVPYYKTLLTPGAQSSFNTNELARVLGETFNVSPMKIQHAMEGYFGTIGIYIFDAADRVTREFTGRNQPLIKLRDLPLAGRLTLDISGAGGLQAQFYELKNDVDSIVSTFNKLKNEGRIKEAYAFKANNIDTYMLKDELQAIEKYMKRWRKRRDAISQHRTLSIEQRGVAMEQLELERDRRLWTLPLLSELSNRSVREPRI